MLSMYHILNRKTSKKCKKFYFFVYFLYKNAFFPYFSVLFLSTKYLNRHLKYHQGACFLCVTLHLFCNDSIKGDTLPFNGIGRAGCANIRRLKRQNLLSNIGLIVI